MGHSTLSIRSQRFYRPGFQGYLLGQQQDHRDRFVVDLTGTQFSVNASDAIIIDAESDPATFEALSQRFYRQFWSPQLSKWV